MSACTWNRCFTRALVLVVALLAAACSQSRTMASDGQTHWLHSCESDEDCGELNCVCGLCSATCRSDEACESLSRSSAVCIGAERLPSVELCEQPPDRTSLCLASCERNRDCTAIAPGLRCEEGVCARAAVGVPGDGGAAPDEDGAVRAGLREPCQGRECQPGLVCATLECSGDNPPVCLEAPEGCDDVLTPVCSCGDETFTNECELERGGQVLSYDGECVVEDGLLRAGPWGGDGMSLVVTESSATLVLPCTEGTIDVAPVISPRDFSAAGLRTATWSGTYGPREGALAPVEYHVQMGQHSAALELQIMAGAASVGPFRLRYGEQVEPGFCEEAPWPDDALLAGTLDEIEAAACRVDLDLNSDGTIDQRWAYEYREGRLARTLVWYAPPDTRGIEAIVHHDDSRVWASCHARYCELYTYRDAHTFDPLDRCPDVADCLLPVERGTGPEIERKRVWAADSFVPSSSSIDQLDEAGRLVRHYYAAHLIDAAGDHRYHEFNVDHYDAQGRLIHQEESGCNSCTTVSDLTYHPNGKLAHYVYRGDPDNDERRCDDQGWLLYGASCEDDLGDGCDTATVSYTRDTQNVITASQVVYAWDDDPVSQNFTTQWTWNSTGGAVSLVSTDDLGAWTYQHSLVVDPVAPEIVQVSADEDRVEVDLDADGTPDAVHALYYTETPDCFARRMPELAEIPLDLPIVWPGTCLNPVPAGVDELYHPDP